MNPKLWTWQFQEGLLHEFRWYEYVLEDYGNTEAAEQKFSQIRKYKGVLRNMRMYYALFYLSIMIEHNNHDTHCNLIRDGKNPTGADEVSFKSKNRKRSPYMNMQSHGIRATTWEDEDEDDEGENDE
jgi:hypothetical protein